MSARCKKILLCVTLLFHAIPALASDKSIILDSLNVRDDLLCVSYHVDSLIDAKFIQGLERGFTSQVVHQVRLWQSKTLFSALVQETAQPITVYYDSWADKYAVVTERENRLTNQIGTVQEICTRVLNYPLVPVAELDPQGKYYISIKLITQPISAEAYEELREWISGGRTKPDSAASLSLEKPSRGPFFNVLIDLLGFGDKSISLKTRDFVLIEKKRVQFLD